MKHDPEDPVMLICYPVDLATEVIAGSIINRCLKCGREVWTAPTGQQILADNKHGEIYCPSCGLVLMKEEEAKGEEVRVFMRKEQVWEVMNHRRRN